jgi:uncharacterized lipoprotein YajG
MAPDRIEIELAAMRKSITRTMTWMIAIVFAVLVLLVGGWARSEIKTANNTADIEAYRKAALNKQAFFSHVNSDQSYQDAIKELVSDPQIKAVIEEFNKRMDAIHDEIMATQTEIVPRGAVSSSNNKMIK